MWQKLFQHSFCSHHGKRKLWIELEGALDVNEERLIIDQLSIIELPTSISAFHGLGSEPFILFDSVAYDKLHEFHFGVLGIIADGVYKYCWKSRNFKVFVSRSVIDASRRLRDLPLCSKLARCPYFWLYIAPRLEDGWKNRTPCMYFLISCAYRRYMWSSSSCQDEVLQAYLVAEKVNQK